MPAYFTALITRKKLIYHISDFYADSRSGMSIKVKKIIRKLEYFIISKADTTIICTEERKEQIKGSKPKKLEIIHNSPVSSVDYETYHYNTNEKISIVYVGALSSSRFIMEAIEVVAKFSEIDFTIAGYGILEKSVKDASLKYNNIKFLGRISYSEALDIYSKGDVILAIYSPEIENHKYSAPNKIYESMMLGKPIIVARGTSADKIVLKHQMGYVINYSKQDFEATLIKMIKDHDFRMLGNNAREAYKEYSWYTMRDRLKKKYICL